MSCKLELELCGYVKDNCTKALEVCDFDCEDGEMSPIQWVVTIIFYIAIAYGAYRVWKFCKKRDEDKIQRKEDARVGAQIRNRYTDNTGVQRPQQYITMQPPQPLQQPGLQIFRDRNGNLRDRNGNLVDQYGNLVDQYGNLVDQYGNIIVYAEPRADPRTQVPDPSRALNQPTVF